MTPVSIAPQEPLWQLHRYYAIGLRIWSPCSPREVFSLSALSLVQVTCLLSQCTVVPLLQPFISMRSSKALGTNYQTSSRLGPLMSFQSEVQKLGRCNAQQFSTAGDSPPSSRDIWQGPGTVLYLGTGRCYWHLQIEEAKDVVPHPTVNRTSRYRNKNTKQNANRAKQRIPHLEGWDKDCRGMICVPKKKKAAGTWKRMHTWHGAWHIADIQ